MIGQHSSHLSEFENKAKVYPVKKSSFPSVPRVCSFPSVTSLSRFRQLQASFPKIETLL